MSDNILLEIKEDMQRDQMIQFFKKHGKYLAVLAVLVVVGIAGFEIWKNQDIKKRSAVGDQLYATITNFNQLKNPNKLREIAANSSYRDIATLIEANWQESQLDNDEMVKTYQKVANDPNANPALKELAELNVLSAKLNANPSDAKAEEELKKLTADNKTFRFTAMEMLGGYYKKNGKLEEARGVYEKLANNPAAPASLSGRAKSMLSSF